VTWLFPADQDRPWLPRAALIVPALGLLANPFLTYDEYIRPLPAQSLVAAALGVALVAAALRAPRPVTGADPPAPGRLRLRLGGRDRDRRRGRDRTVPATPRPRLLAVVVFFCTGAQFVLTYAVRPIGLPWPLGLVIALAPIALGIFAVRRLITTGPLGRDGFWVVTGILSFFIVHDIVIGATGRYSLIAGGLLAALGLVLVHRRAHAVRPAGADNPGRPADADRPKDPDRLES
jgi:hypothetical protein